MMRNPTSVPVDLSRTARNARRVGFHALMLAAVTALFSCDSATTVKLLQIDATGEVVGYAFVDGNDNQVYDAGDQPLKDVSVVLQASKQGTVVNTVTTDSVGFYAMPDVPVGSYHVTLSADVLGDSLEIVSDSTQDVELQRGDTTHVDFGVSFPVLSIAQIRDLPVGKRIFTSGIALNPNVSYVDARLHIQADSSYLRAINVARGTVQTGDSIRLAGRIANDNGEPVLDDVTPMVLVNGARIPAPVDVSTGEAAVADGGRLDAALARVRAAEILDTATVDGDFHFHIDDGSGVLEVVVPAFEQINSSLVFPDSILRVNRALGLLVPIKDVNGSTTWRLYPRGGSDLTLEYSQVDVGVAMKASTSIATLGDSVRFTLVLTNKGPLDAVGVQISDTIPTGLSLIGSTATAGSYSQATRLWSVDTVKVGDSDTLTLATKVTTAVPSTLTNRAYYTGSKHQVDTNTSNNVAAASVTVVTVKQADIGVLLSAHPTSLSVGDTLELDISATNGGPFRATSVRIASAIPGGFTFLDASATRGNYSASAGRWFIDTLRAGATESVTVRATVASTTTTFTVVDSAYSMDTQDVQDPNPRNNVATATITAGPQLPVDLALQVSASKTTVRKGDTVAIRVVLNNTSASAVTGTGGFDTLPSGLTYLSSTTSRGSYNAGSGTWVVDSLQASSADTLVLRALVSTDEAGTLVNRVHLRGPDHPAVDINGANNDAQVTITVTAATGEDELTARGPLGADRAPGSSLPYPPILSPTRRILPRVAGSTTLPNDGFTVTGTVKVSPERSMGFEGSTRRSALSTTPDWSSMRLKPSTVR